MSTRRHLPRRSAAALLVVACLALAACGSSKEDTTEDGSGTTVATTSSTSGSAATDTTLADEAGGEGIDPLADASTEPKSGAATGSGVALLDAVRVARHEGYDRVVFQFQNQLPGYLVEYASLPVTEDGSGNPVTLEGQYALQVRMEPASGVDLSATDAPSGYVETYTGPTRIDAGTPEITEVVRTGDFEAVLTWVIGLRDRVDFRVTTLSSPPRLVVDVRNH